MATSLEDYLSYLNEDSEYINEGALTFLNKILVVIGFGSPADVRFQAILKANDSCLNVCNKAFPDETTSTTTQSGNYKIGKEKNEKQLKKEREETIKTIKKNPNRGKCMMMCYYDKLKEMVNTIKTYRKNICSNNINKDLCEKWIAKKLPDMEANLKALANAIRLMQGSGSVNTNTLNKIL